MGLQVLKIFSILFCSHSRQSDYYIMCSTTWLGHTFSESHNMHIIDIAVFINKEDAQTAPYTLCMVSFHIGLMMYICEAQHDV